MTKKGKVRVDHPPYVRFFLFVVKARVSPGQCGGLSQRGAIALTQAGCFASFSLRYRPCHPSCPNALLPLVTHPLTPPPLSHIFFGRFSGVFPGKMPRSQHNKTGFLHNRHTPKTQDRSRVANAVLRSRRVFCWMEHFKYELLFFHIPTRRNCLPVIVHNGDVVKTL